ncbi:ATP-binding protein [Actinoplanes sp. NEAU-A12]|uniref:Sensor-like histidine kinase SenX3 n=1 Tax=Actinoplanes sandaracinus TaxID=3045177 RepID=A0ABT6WS15_9ACTN|nr:ATP-binding protein [Actinoplanes sandaracinus]MDI6102534.1 ATP-binding protein [Actinoplanes sandaracinus]
MRGKRTVISALVALVGCGLALGVGIVLERHESSAGAIQMDRRTATAAEAVRSETQRYVDTLLTTAAAAGAQDELTMAEYTALTEPLKSMNLAGATSVALVVPASHDQVPEVQQRWRQRGLPGLELLPYGTGDHLFSVYVTPLDGNDVTPGTDLIRAEAPAAAMADSRRSGEVTVSDTYHLIVDQGLPPERRQSSFVLTAPVHQGPDQRFLGWIVLGVRGQDFMGATLAQAGQGLLDLALRADDPERREVIVASLRAAVPGERDLRRTVTVEVADGTWALHLAAVGDRLPGAASALPLAVAGGGLCLTLLLTMLVWVLATGRERAEARVRLATAELLAGEEQSHRQARLLTAVLDGISDGVGVVGPDGRFLLHNPAARRILGEGGKSAGPGAWPDHSGLFRLDGVAPYPVEELPLTRALRGEDSDQVEMIVRNPLHPDGRVISVSARPIDTAAGERGAVAVFHDITDRKHVENELRGFAGVVAHDLKAPLTLVHGYAELIIEALAEPGAGPDAVEDALRSAGKVISGADRMQNLITELLDYTAARDATMRIADVGLRELVDDVVTTRIDAPGVPEAAPDVFVGCLPHVRGDRVLLRQVFDNLVGNAIKYTPPGQAPRIDVTAEVDDAGTVCVQVADRGIGIPDGEHAAVFDSFHRASNGRGTPGTGLGLAICRRIVERHGGRIEALPNPGGGTIFAFTLPTECVLTPTA